MYENIRQKILSKDLTQDLRRFPFKRSCRGLTSCAFKTPFTFLRACLPTGAVLFLWAAKQSGYKRPTRLLRPTRLCDVRPSFFSQCVYTRGLNGKSSPRVHAHSLTQSAWATLVPFFGAWGIAASLSSADEHAAVALQQSFLGVSLPPQGQTGRSQPKAKTQKQASLATTI